MKNYIITLFLLFPLTFLVSCEGYLDKPPYGVLTEDIFYKTPDELLQGLTDAYNYIGASEFETALFALGNIMTDDGEKGGSDINDQAAMYELSRFRAVSSNAICLQLWTICYRGIYNCNIVIEKSETLESINPDLVKRIKAEAKFLRGFYYFHLASVFGGVPLVLTPLAPSDLQVARASFDATWDQIEKDFSEAAAVLPMKSQYSSADIGRATSGAAYTMLAKSYLMRQKYALAEAALKNVVSSNQYSLVSDYGKIFTKAFANGAESVFEIQHKNTNSSGGSEGTALNRFCWSRKNGGWGFDLPTEDLKKEFETGDPRLIYTLTFTGDVFIGNDVIDNSESQTGYHNRKIYLAPVERDSPEQDQGYNIRYLRYADVLLLYAEVLNENGKSQEALGYLNVIRDRARNTNPVDPRRISQKVSVTVNLPAVTISDKNQLRNSIWHERRVELGMEYHRRVDLIRQKRFGNVMKAYASIYNNDKGSLFNESYHNLCPIPAEEIDRSGGIIAQNPGY